MDSSDSSDCSDSSDSSDRSDSGDQKNILRKKHFIQNFFSPKKFTQKKNFFPQTSQNVTKNYM